MECGNYANEQKSEENVFSDAEDYMKSVTTKKNDAPEFEEIEVSKDLDESTGNWIKVKTSGTDKENNTLDYTLKLWKKENEEIDEHELIKKEPTRKTESKNIKSGEEAILEISGLEEYTDYLYRVEVTDKINITEGEINKIRTYCKGTGAKCSRRNKMFNLQRNRNT